MTNRGDRLAAVSEAKRAGRRLVVLTAYDYPMGRLLDEEGIDLVLVGDSLGMVVLGYPDTTSVTMTAMEHHVGAVSRGVTRAPVIADLPYRSYENARDAVDNTRRLVAAGADAVKLEGGRGRAEAVRAIVGAGIPLMGHLGMLPQSVREEGGYRIKGRSDAERERLLTDATFLEAQGAFSVVLELVTPPVAEEITRTLRIPTIGIGSGPGCDGQVLVVNDLVGSFPWFRPKFARARADVAAEIRGAVRAFAEEVRGAS